MMGWVGSGEDFCWLGWVGLGPEILGWVGLGFEKVTHDQLWSNSPAQRMYQRTKKLVKVHLTS